jgi:dethiobiotin synthetase
MVSTWDCVDNCQYYATATPKMIDNTLFITGTDTSVGKTFVCARLLEFLHGKGIQAGYQKWVATGVEAEIPDDLALCLKAANIPIIPELVARQAPYRFKYPASPHLAAELEGGGVDPEIITENYKTIALQYQWLIVEGVGGIMVPLRRDLLLVDLLARLKPKILVVARSGLGTLNHTLLTIEALRHRHIPILGIVFSDSAAAEDERLVEDNMKAVEEMGLVKVFGRLKRERKAGDVVRAFGPIGQAIWDQLLQLR